MALSTTWITATEPDWSLLFNRAADVTYGSICCLSFVIGTFGNTVSFLYFKAKKRDISSVIYMMITANDAVISLAVLPVGISFWLQRRPGYLLGNEYGCAVWFYVWTITVSLSIFLVICLSITRTISLLTPFKKHRTQTLTIAVVAYLVFQLARIVGCHMLAGIKIVFAPHLSRAVMVLTDTYNTAVLLSLEVGRNLTYIAPALAVAVSCAISVFLLSRSHTGRQQAVQQTRNRATVTILLFALLYGVCNVPLVVELVMATYSRHTNSMRWYRDVFTFDTQSYYYNAVNTLLVGVNSAANPLLYMWRMSRLRTCVLTGTRKMLRRSSELRTPPNDMLEDNEEESVNRVEQNNIVPY